MRTDYLAIARKLAHIRSMRYRIAFFCAVIALLIVTPFALRSNDVPTYPLPTRFIDPANPNHFTELTAGSIRMCWMTDETHRVCNTMTMAGVFLSKETMFANNLWMSNSEEQLTIDGAKHYGY